MTKLKVGFEIECGLDLPQGMGEWDFQAELESIGFDFTRDAHHYENMHITDLEAVTRGRGRTDYIKHLNDFIKLMNKMEKYKSEPISTGLHINISPADGFFEKDTLANILLIYLKLEEELYSLVPDERQQNRYSGINCSAGIEELKDRIKGMSINNFKSGRFEDYIKQKNQEIGLKYAGLGFHQLCRSREEDKRIEFRFFDAKLSNLKKNTKIAVNIIKKAQNNTTYEVLKKIEKIKSGDKSIEDFLHL